MFVHTILIFHALHNVFTLNDRNGKQGEEKIMCMVERSKWADAQLRIKVEINCSGIVVVDRRQNCEENCFRPSYPLSDLR